jgi:hypothetical protein
VNGPTFAPKEPTKPAPEPTLEPTLEPTPEIPTGEEPANGKNGEPSFWAKWFTKRNIAIGIGALAIGLFWWRHRKEKREEEEGVGECPACTLAGFKEALGKAQQARSIGNCDQALNALLEAKGIGADYDELAAPLSGELAELKKSCLK